MDSTANTSTIRIGRKDFTVTTQVTSYGELQYILTGKRGAVYGTMRNVNRKDMMFLIGGSVRGHGPNGAKTVWLTDRNGALEVVS